MSAAVVYFEHVLCPHKREVLAVPQGLTVQALAPVAWKNPYIAVLDGEAVLRKDWDLRLVDGQVLAFVDVRAIPQGGGGGKNPMRIIATFALMVFAPMAAGWATTQLINTAFAGLSLSAATAFAPVLHGALTAGFIFGGSMLINAVLPPSSQQLSSLGQHEAATPSPTYSIGAQGNSARIGGAIPEHFGRHIVWPDFAAMPYQEFSGNEQFVYQLLCIGRGYYDLETIRIEDTAIENFDEITYEVIEPGGTLTLFPANVITAPEVVGQDLEHDVYSGPFIASAATTVANYIGVDFVAPRGLYKAEDSGKLTKQSITVTVEAREVDDNGAPIGAGAYTTLGTHTYTAATATPQRYSQRYELTTPGRYEVRVKRTTAKNAGTRFAHDLLWGGLRAYLRDTKDYGDVTLLAMRMRASSQLSAQSSRRVNLIATRKLPIYRGNPYYEEGYIEEGYFESGWSETLEPTRSISSAAYYICKAMGWPDSQIAMNDLGNLHNTWTGRGDYFDGRFDNFVSAWEALEKVAAAGRAQRYIQAGVIRIVRDQAQVLPVALFSMRNILRGSLSIEYLMPTPETADRVDVRYFDRTVWAYRTVPAKLPTSEQKQPAKHELFGVVERAQAFREGMYQAASNRYRRKLVTFTTEMEGFIPSPGDLIAIQHDMPGWGQGGEVQSWDGVGQIATLSEPLTWQGGETHYIAFRTSTGGVDGPYECIPGPEDNEVELLEAPAIEPQTGRENERTHYSFGWGVTIYQRAVMIGARPVDGFRVEIIAVQEDDNVHTAEDGEITPTAPVSQLAGFTAAPIVRGLRARSLPDDPGTIVLSWEPSPWADSYLIEQSVDMISWVRFGETRASNWTGPALYGKDTIIRVAAIGAGRGPWAYTYYSVDGNLMWDEDDETLMWDLDDETLMWS